MTPEQRAERIHLTTNEARAYFASRGMEYTSDLTKLVPYPIRWGDVIRLWCMCEDHMDEAELEMHMRTKPDIRTNRYGHVKEAYLRVQGPYFSNREAISFNVGGFIGFAGWASDKNVVPFVNAFVEWVDWFVDKYGERVTTT